MIDSSTLAIVSSTCIHIRLYTYVNYGGRYTASTDRKGSTQENPGEWLSWIASRCEGDEEERNCDKGCWQAVTGTTLSATRFCAYHSPWVYYHRRQCRPQPIWSDLILVTLIHHPFSIRHLPSYTISTWSRRSLYLSREILLIFATVTLVFLRYPQSVALLR